MRFIQMNIIKQIFIAAMLALMLTTAVYSSLGIDTQHVKAESITYKPVGGFVLYPPHYQTLALVGGVQTHESQFQNSVYVR